MADPETDREAAPERTLQGRRVDPLSDEDRASVLAEACEYRGDVTLELEDGASVVGYVFANETGVEPPRVRLFPKGSTEKMSIAHAEIVAVEFSGVDTAFGRSWEAWIRRRDRVAGEAGAEGEDG